ncbi:hypothetical protein [Novosphingobium colocasiae]|uniref:hypothetical protein n=1 Tax=Novosphingobium colocasiae TaxID=1256513 RepID=UPI0035B1C6B4
MLVGCKLPHGLEISHEGVTVTLVGANVGYDGDNPWRNGGAPDSADRISGVGLTKLEGAQADAVMAWMDISGRGPGPVKSGMIFAVDTKAEASKEAQLLEDEKTGLDGIDPAKDLPKGVETDTDAPKSKK